MTEWRSLKLEVSDGGDLRLEGKDLLTRADKNAQYQLLNLSVHRLIALAFLGPSPFDGAVVNHLDGDPRNNRASNLEWVTQSENLRHKPFATDGDKVNLAAEDIAEIKTTLSRQVIPVSTLATMYGVSPTLIRSIRKHQVWTDREVAGLKLSWEEVEEIRATCVSLIEIRLELAKQYNVPVRTIRSIEAGLIT